METDGGFRSCVDEHAIRFDGGELQRVVAHLAAASDDPAAPALAFVEEVFPGEPAHDDDEPADDTESDASRGGDEAADEIEPEKGNRPGVLPEPGNQPA